MWYKTHEKHNAELTYSLSGELVREEPEIDYFVHYRCGSILFLKLLPSSLFYKDLVNTAISVESFVPEWLNECLSIFRQDDGAVH